MHKAGDCGLGLEIRLFGQIFFFDGHVHILCGIKDFAAGLAFYEFCVFLAGDDFDDGMFAGDGHDMDGSYYGVCPSPAGLSTVIL